MLDAIEFLLISFSTIVPSKMLKRIFSQIQYNLNELYRHNKAIKMIIKQNKRERIQDKLRTLYE